MGMNWDEYEAVLGADGTRVMDTLIWFHEASLSTVDACEPVQKKKRKISFLMCKKFAQIFKSETLVWTENKTRRECQGKTAYHDREF